MLIDSSRYSDLANLTRIKDDEDKPEPQRRRAARTIEKIKRDMTDRYIRDMRHRIIRATNENDIDEIWKLSEQLHEYEYYNQR